MYTHTTHIYILFDSCENAKQMKHIHMHVNKHFRNNSEKLTKNANGILALSLCVRVFFLLFLFHFPQMKQMKNEMNEMKLQAITYVTVLDCDSTMLSHHILCHMYACEWEWAEWLRV